MGPPEIYLARFGWARYLDRRGKTCAATGILTTMMLRFTQDGLAGCTSKGVEQRQRTPRTGALTCSDVPGTVRYRYRYRQDGTKAHVSISCCAINFAKLVLEPLAIHFRGFDSSKLRPPFAEPPPISLCDLEAQRSVRVPVNNIESSARGWSYFCGTTARLAVLVEGVCVCVCVRACCSFCLGTVIGLFTFAAWMD